MKLHTYSSVQLFLEKTERFLETNEAANNLPLGLLYGLRQKEKQGEAITNVYLGVVDDDLGNTVLVVLLNSMNLIVSGDSASSEIEPAARMMARNLYEAGRDVPGVVGEQRIAEYIASEWTSITSKALYYTMNQRIYRLDRVEPIRVSQGKLRLAEAADAERVADWIYGFAEEIRDPMSKETALAKARENIAGSTLYIWDHGGPVSMAKKSRPTRNGIVLSLVYTPSSYRNKGYASSCVAALSRLLLEEGYQFCSLYTDLSNPTSNDIYQKIGYRPVLDSVMYRFQ